MATKTVASWSDALDAPNEDWCGLLDVGAPRYDQCGPLDAPNDNQCAPNETVIETVIASPEASATVSIGITRTIALSARLNYIRIAPHTPVSSLISHDTRLNRPSACLTTRPSALDSTRPQQSVPDCAVRKARASLARRGGCPRLWLTTVKLTAVTKCWPMLTSTMASTIAISRATNPPSSRSLPTAPLTARPSVCGRQALCCAHSSSSAFTLSMERWPLPARSVPLFPPAAPGSLHPAPALHPAFCTARAAPASRTLNVEFRIMYSQDRAREKGAKALNRKAHSPEVHRACQFMRIQSFSLHLPSS